MRINGVCGVIALALLAAPLSSVAMATENNPGIVPNVALPHGSSYGEWMQEWSRWVVSPSWDDWASEGCGARQSGMVFLHPGFATPLGENPTCVVPPGHMIFVPFQFVVAWNPEDCTDAEDCANVATSWNDRMVSTYVEIDGMPVDNPWQYRATTEPFALELAPDAWLSTYYMPGVRNPTVTDGFFLMLEPLPVGEHTVFIRNEWPLSTNEFTLSITVRPAAGPMKPKVMDE